MPAPSSAPNQRALICALAAVGLWSTMATAFKWALEFGTPMALIALATTVSWCFFSVRIFLTGRLQSLLEMTRVLVLQCLLLGLLNPAFYYWILFTAYDLLPAQDAMAINYTWGLTLPLIAAFFSRTLPNKHEAGLALFSYLGILTIATNGNLVSLEFDRPLGVALALFSNGHLGFILGNEFTCHGCPRDRSGNGFISQLFCRPARALDYCRALRAAAECQHGLPTQWPLYWFLRDGHRLCTLDECDAFKR